MEQFKVCLWLHSGEYLEKHFATEADARKVMESMWMVPQVCKVHLCLVRVLEGRAATGARPGLEQRLDKDPAAKFR